MSDPQPPDAPGPHSHDTPVAPGINSDSSTAHHAAGADAATDVILDLLVVWDEQRRQGLDPTPEKLCAGRPELLPEFRARLGRLRRFEAAADERPAAAAPLPPVPGYELLGTLGEGGMGVVYLARHLGLKRLVALKMVRSAEWATPDQLRRFRAEAEAVARLQHPNIVQVYEIGEDNGRPYFTIEYCAGGSLKDRLDGTPMPPARSAGLVETLAVAVQAAHEAGVVHRDLKPGNVLLAGPDRATPKVADFGLAKTLDADDGQTRSGAIMGTPSYMAPEQAEGKTREVGPSADVYALGAILYELLTGRPPFKGETYLETLDQVRGQEPVPPRQFQPKLPRDLETVALKCLQKDPAKRYPTAAALADDLGRWREGRPILARPVGRLGRLTRWAKRNPAVATLAAGLGLLLAGTAVAGWLAAAHFEDAARLEQGLRVEVQQTNAELEQASYTSRLAQADRELRGIKGHPLDVALAESLLDGCPERLRGWEWHYLYRLLDGPPAELKGHEKGVWCVAYDPAGKTVASAGIDGRILVWDAATGRALHDLSVTPFRFGALTPVIGVAFSPDGSRLAAVTGNVIQVWDAARGAMLTQLAGHTQMVVGVTFSPDGSRIASAGFDQTVRVWDAAGGKLIHTLECPEGGWANRVAFHPDGRRLASGHSDGAVRVWDAVDGKPLAAWGGHLGSTHDVAYDREGKRLASAGMDGALRVRDADTGELLHVFTGHNNSAVAVAFHPDGDRLASGGLDNTVRVWDASTGRLLLTLYGHSHMVWSVAFSPDGRRLASGSFDNTVRLWDASPPERLGPDRLRLLAGHNERVNGVAFSGDGRLLASAGWDRTARLWDPDTGRELRALEGHTAMVANVAVSADGKRVATASWDWTARVWDAASGRELVAFRGHRGGAHGIAFSPDGLRAASTGLDGSVKVWDAATGAEVFDLKGHPLSVYAVAFSPDGSLIATAGVDGRVWLWDARTGKNLVAMQGHEMVVHRLAFRPDGKVLASASWDGTIGLWDVPARKPLRMLRGHMERVHGVAFSADGRLLASSAEDKTVRLWDPESGKEVMRPVWHRGAAACVVFRPGGDWLATASWYAPAGVRLWKLPDDRPR